MFYNFSHFYICYSLNSSTLSALFVLIGISIIVAGGFLSAFLWSVKHGQYDDDYTPSVRMLFDDEIISATNDTSIKPSTKTNK